jgi:uncharacterized membrane protein
MKEVHVISIIGIIYAILLALVSFIFFRDYMVWAILGSAVSLFNHSQMIHVTKNGLKTERLVFHLIQRYILMIIIVVIVFFDTKGQDFSIVRNSYIFLVLGFIATKIGVYVYHTPLIKKKKEEEVKSDEHHKDAH